MIIAAENFRKENNPELKLIIAVGSSNRSQTLKNPWSDSERIEMILFWLDNEVNFEATIVSIPDIEDPPNWVSHAERYHGKQGVFFSSDSSTSELYEISEWPIVSTSLIKRGRFEGWRVRELSLIHI